LDNSREVRRCTRQKLADSICPCSPSVHDIWARYPQALYKVVSGLVLVLDSPMLGQTEQRDMAHGRRFLVPTHFVARFRWSLHGPRRVGGAVHKWWPTSNELS
jgi:hypothetical protein